MSEDNTSNFGMGLSEALESLRNELQAAAVSGNGKSIKFQLKDVKVEFALVTSKKIGGKSGIKWFVLNAEASGEFSDAVTQKVTLSMDVIDTVTNKTLEVKGDAPDPNLPQPEQ